TILPFLFLIVACSSASTGAGPSSDKICTPGAYVYCRCQDREEGTKLCHEDGKGFDRCEPCESETNPESPGGPTPYEPEPQTDAGPAQEAGKCGDKIVQEGEECDDGNTDETDGCNASCRLAGADAPSSRSCPGMAIHLFGDAVTFTTSTLGAPNTTSVK